MTQNPKLYRTKITDAVQLLRKRNNGQIVGFVDKQGVEHEIRVPVVDSLADVPAGAVGPVFTADGQQYFNGYANVGRRLPLNQKMPRSIIDLSGSIGAEWVKTGTSDASIETSIKAPNQNQSLRISVPGGGSNTTLTKELSAPVVLDDAELITFLFYTPRIPGDATSQQCSMWLYMNSGSIDRYSLNVNLGRNSSYVQITVKKSDFTANGIANWQNINRIRFQISAHATLHREIYLLGIYAGQKARATFCLTVDDSTLTDFTEIDAYCWPRGVPVTYCIIPSLIDNNPGYLTSDKLLLLKAHGNSLICHDSSNWEETYLANPAGFPAHLDSIKAFVAQYDPDGANFSSLPEGRYGDTDSSETAQAILSILNQKFLASRLTKMSSTGMSLAPIFPSAYEYQLFMSQLSESDNQLAWEAEINSICDYGNLGIGYIHRVVPGVAGPVEINRDVFRAIVDYLVAKRDAGLVDLVSFPELYRRSILASQQLLVE